MEAVTRHNHDRLHKNWTILFKSRRHEVRALDRKTLHRAGAVVVGGSRRSPPAVAFRAVEPPEHEHDHHDDRENDKAIPEDCVAQYHLPMAASSASASPDGWRCARTERRNG